MFPKTIDSKKKYTNADGYELVDLSEGIFNRNNKMSQICSVLKLTKEYEMRPDLVSNTLYGSTDYTEMVLKYSLIPNPFMVEEGDVIYDVAMSYIYNPVKDIQNTETQSYNFVKKYHKYIDKNKIPSTVGSEKDTTEIISNTSESASSKSTESGIEPNISKTGNGGITIKNGKVYFGTSVGDDNENSSGTTSSVNGGSTNSGSTDNSSIDPSLVNCAEDGVTLGEFLNATISNYNK